MRRNFDFELLASYNETPRTAISHRIPGILKVPEILFQKENVVVSFRFSKICVELFFPHTSFALILSLIQNSLPEELPASTGSDPGLTASPIMRKEDSRNYRIPGNAECVDRRDSFLCILDSHTHSTSITSISLHANSPNVTYAFGLRLENSTASPDVASHSDL